MSLAFRVRRRGDAVTVFLTGRIDREAGTALGDAYAEARRAPASVIQLEFADVDYINSTGIALIVGVLARARSEKVAVRASGLTPHYQHIFQITRLSDFIEILAPAQK